jgi:hypothetical protein
MQLLCNNDKFLPTELIIELLKRLPLQQRLGNASLVCRQYAAAANAATQTVCMTGLSSQQQANVDALNAWLCRPGNDGLLCLVLSGLLEASQAPAAVSMPWQRLTSLQHLDMSNLEVLLADTSLATSAGDGTPDEEQHLGLSDHHAVPAVLSTAAPLAAPTTSTGSTGVVSLAALTRLTYLRLAECTNNDRSSSPNAAALAAMLSNLVSLDTLRLEMPLPGNFFSIADSSFCKLWRLDLSNAGSSTDPLVLHPSLGNLKALWLQNCCVSWPVDWQFTQLTFLVLQGCAQTSPAVMAGMPWLIDVGYRPLSNEPDRQDGNELLAVVEPLQKLKFLELNKLDFTPDLPDDVAAYPSMEEEAAQRCAALTASRELEKLDLMWCVWPAGAMRHMFPAGRQLLRLREVNIRFVSGAERHNWWHRTAWRKQLSLAAGPGDVARLAEGCPYLQMLSLLWANAIDGITLSELRLLTQLTALDKLGVAGDAWNDEATEGVLANMPGEAGLAVQNNNLL